MSQDTEYYVTALAIQYIMTSVFHSIDGSGEDVTTCCLWLMPRRENLH